MKCLKFFGKIWTTVYIVALVLLIVTASIALPIYIRPFYYAHIDRLDLVEQTGHTEEEIRQAYGEVLDYLTFPDKEFGTGVFKWSEDGKQHFDDCKPWFMLNATVLLASAVFVLCVMLDRKRRIPLSRPLGLRPSAFAGGLTLVAFSAIGAFVAADFENAFWLFHDLLFPGKDNWQFDAARDEIINALPEEFFMSCAVCICASILVISLILLISGIVARGREKRKANKLQAAESAE